MNPVHSFRVGSVVQLNGIPWVRHRTKNESETQKDLKNGEDGRPKGM